MQMEKEIQFETVNYTKKVHEAEAERNLKQTIYPFIGIIFLFCFPFFSILSWDQSWNTLHYRSGIIKGYLKISYKHSIKFIKQSKMLFLTIF